MKSLIILILLTACVSAKPIRPIPTPKVKAKQTLPDLNFTCQYGVIKQFGRELTIEGCTWNASGTIRPDGKVQFVWVLIGDTSMRVALSVYEVQNDGQLRGLWGWGPETTIDEMGRCVGPVMNDRIYPVE